MLAIKNATILDGTGNIIENGTIVLHNGKIEAVGDDNIDIPTTCDVLDAEGCTITPGLIDAHTHLGVEEMGIGEEGQDLNEETSPTTPEVRAIDGINMFESGFDDARAAGITTVQVLPGSSNVIGGEMATVKTQKKIVDACILRAPSGMKAAMGENPKATYGSKGKAPMTRMGVAAILRQSLMEARSYQKKKAAGDTSERLDMEHLVKVLNKEIPLRVHAHRADDIISVLRIKDEFNIEVGIEHCTEGHKIADIIAESGIRVTVGPTMSPRSKVETADKGWHTPKILADAGIPIVLTTDHSVIGIQYLIASAIMAVKHGLSEKQALQAITLNAAEHLEVDERIGSLERGKDADLVLWDGDIFDLRTNVLKTFIDGEEVFSKNRCDFTSTR